MSEQRSNGDIPARGLRIHAAEATPETGNNGGPFTESGGLATFISRKYGKAFTESGSLATRVLRNYGMEFTETNDGATLILQNYGQELTETRREVTVHVVSETGLTDTEADTGENRLVKPAISEYA